MMTQTQQCDLIFPLVTSSEVYQRKLVGHKYFVELASIKWELQDSRAVPVSAQEIDVLVAEPTIQAIERLLVSGGWLKDWQIVSYSRPDAHEAPF